MKKHELITKIVKLGRKGQLTLPKIIRKKEGLKEKDEFILLHIAGGEIVLRKRNKKTPEDLMLEAIEEAPPFDAKKAWEEVKAERRDR